MFSVPALGGKKIPPNYPYIIDRSLRFRAIAASTNLLRSGWPAETSNTTKTYSFWFKRGTLTAAYQNLLGGRVDGSNYWLVTFTDTHKLRISQVVGAATVIERYSTQSFNTLSFIDGWHHIVIALDSTLATAGDRVKVWLDGVAITSWTGLVDPAQNATLLPYTGYNAGIGFSPPPTPLYYFDGYFAEVHRIDGLALPPTAFGEFFAPLGNIWVPKEYAGAYGTNGFFLSFNDNSSVAALGNDDSPNSNNFTVAGASLTLGYTYDSMIDTPTDNFTVLDATQGAAAAGNSVVRDGNLWVATATIGAGGVRNTPVPPATAADPFPKTGKWYWEVYGISASEAVAGMAQTSDANNYPLGATGVGSYQQTGAWYYLGAQVATYGVWGNTNTLGFAADCDAGTLRFFINGVEQGSPAQSGINFAGLNWLVALADGSSSASVTLAPNFGQQPFTYTPPTGYLPLSWQGMNGTYVPPVYPESTFVNASTDITGTQVYVNFSQALAGSVTVGTLQYRINGGAFINITGMTVSGSTITGTMPTPAQQGQSLEIWMNGNTTLLTLMTGNAVADFPWTAFPNSAQPLLAQGNLYVGNVNNLFWGKTSYPGYGSYTPASGPDLDLLQYDYTGLTQVVVAPGGVAINGTGNIRVTVGGVSAVLTYQVTGGDESLERYIISGDYLNLSGRAGQSLAVLIQPA